MVDRLVRKYSSHSHILHSLQFICTFKYLSCNTELLRKDPWLEVFEAAYGEKRHWPFLTTGLTDHSQKRLIRALNRFKHRACSRSMAALNSHVSPAAEPYLNSCNMSVDQPHTTLKYHLTAHLVIRRLQHSLCRRREGCCWSCWGCWLALRRLREPRLGRCRGVVSRRSQGIGFGMRVELDRRVRIRRGEGRGARHAWSMGSCFKSLECWKCRSTPYRLDMI